MTSDSVASVRDYWRGLGLWNIYFIAKLILYWAGYLNFHAFYNLVFASILLLPLPPLWLHRLRHVLAVPGGIALLYYDSWLPPFSRLLEQPEVLQFSAPYLLELLNRFINWDMVGAGVLLIVACLFLSQWLRITVLSVAALMVAAIPDHYGPQQLLQNLYAGRTTAIDVQAQSAHVADSDVPAPQPETKMSLTETLNLELADFHDTEAARATAFNPSPDSAGAVDFDIIFLSICSLAWSDLASTQLDQHPLIKSMDVIFDEFNAATAYSGPAVRRLLRASCGQPSHSALYDTAPSHCHLFENLKQMGFQTQAVLNHNGKFQDFISDLTLHPSLAAPIVPAALPPRWTAFDGSPIWGDYETLNHWWQGRGHDASPRAVLYNSVTLHDGNREATADGGGRSASYATRGKVVLDDLHHFIKQLESSGQRAIVVLVPEHGAALKGDMMQIAGMREIPTPDITHVPVGVKLIGHPAKAAPAGRRIAEGTSYLALSELLARMVQRPVFDEEVVDWDALTADLPLTRAVSENSGTVLLSHDNVPYVRLGQRDWIQYRR
ncbi:MAG TPA: cellulose biosynthesis protein BcsG [Pusillimonas sp.]|uniref:cellulose biosynthesis protein BcsG n=1 Tax=Pusillimonas sp. TaxID=3040095 RepID=UPI002BCB1FEC|nr:cellulose biosynthesis protein BcsG [Pusillimonas sp.]HUH88662.1 cellulose biosynthesis protein BcsG [Pusillimonas sp.]